MLPNGIPVAIVTQKKYSGFSQSLFLNMPLSISNDFEVVTDHKRTLDFNQVPIVMLSIWQFCH